MSAPQPAAALNVRQRLIEAIRSYPAKLCHAVGRPIHWEVERARDPALVDHVWITLEIDGGVGLVRASVSTHSLRNEQAGYDGRVRIGVVADTQAHEPGEVFQFADGLDYGRIERELGSSFQLCERDDAECRFLAVAASASLVEVWGHPYIQRHLGIHNIHSMRRSCAIPEDRIGSDGGLRFFFGDIRPPEYWLIKFCGQP